MIDVKIQIFLLREYSLFMHQSFYVNVEGREWKVEGEGKMSTVEKMNLNQINLSTGGFFSKVIVYSDIT